MTTQPSDSSEAKDSTKGAACFGVMEGCYQDHLRVAPATPGQQTAEGLPRVVCLCGSSKWPQYHMEVMMRETLSGRIVIPMGLYGHADFPTGARAATCDGDESTEVKQMLDRLHFAKIDKSDQILVVRVAGYIGSSTAREIAYAESTGKMVRYVDYTASSEPTPQPEARGTPDWKEMYYAMKYQRDSAQESLKQAAGA